MTIKWNRRLDQLVAGHGMLLREPVTKLPRGLVQSGWAATALYGHDPVGGPRPVSEQGHERRFRPHSAMSALAPITTKPTTLHNGREGPIATEVRCSKTATYSITSSARAKIDCGTLI